MNNYILVFLLLIFIPAGIVSGATLELKGVISDSETDKPIPNTTIHILNSNRTILANTDGQFRVRIEAGSYELRFTHVSHYAQTIKLDNLTYDTSITINLQPAVIELPPIKVYDKRYDAGQLIILEAIKRKQEILRQLKSYSFDAYTKLVVKDTAKDSLEQFLVIAETQLDGFWEYPDKYKEIITARKQTKNMDADNNLISINEILNFNKNRLEINEYSIVTPTAEDALDYYNYYLMDTIVQDNRNLFVLDIEPIDQYDQLFEGTIYIADSSYAVVGVDVTFSKGIDIRFIKDLHYTQEFALFEQQYWMPTVITAEFNIDVPFPMIPKMNINYTAGLHRYQFDPDFNDTVFNEFVLEVAESADDIDTTAWFENQPIPLTEDEEMGYVYVDSVEENESKLKRLVYLPLAALFIIHNNSDFFEFNKVEGPYLGLKASITQLHKNLKFDIKSGYAFDAEKWQYLAGVTWYPDKYKKRSFAFDWHDQIVKRTSVYANSNNNATLLSLFARQDPFDYYKEKGFSIGFSSRLGTYFSGLIRYSDFSQYSIGNNSDYSFFNNDEEHPYRVNPPIIDGKHRAVSFGLSYDSRKFMLNKGNVRKVFESTFTLISATAKIADPLIIDNNFKYKRYSLMLYRRQNLFNLGTFSIYMYGGIANNFLPPQEYFTIDYNSSLMEHTVSLHTLSDNNFYGDRVFTFYGMHRFDRNLFHELGLHFIPVGLEVHGGMFWTEFNNELTIHDPDYFGTAAKPYSELGFGITQLPLFFEMNFTWQLSGYDTNKFSFGIDNAIFRF